MSRVRRWYGLSVYAYGSADPNNIDRFRQRTNDRADRNDAAFIQRLCSQCRKRATTGRWIDFKFVCTKCQEKKAA